MYAFVKLSDFNIIFNLIESLLKFVFSLSSDVHLHDHALEVETINLFNFVFFMLLMVSGSAVVYLLLDFKRKIMSPYASSIINVQTSKRETSDVEQQRRCDNWREIRSAVHFAKMAFIPGSAEKCLEIVRNYQLNVNFILQDLGLSIFLSSCVSGNYDLIRSCLMLGGDVNSQTVSGDSPLYLAVYLYLKHQHPYLVILELLIKAGCDVNAVNKRGYTALHLAAGKGDIELTKFLLDYGASPNLNTSLGTPLSVAVKTGHTAVAELLKNHKRYRHFCTH